MDAQGTVILPFCQHAKLKTNKAHGKKPSDHIIEFSFSKIINLKLQKKSSSRTRNTTARNSSFLSVVARREEAQRDINQDTFLGLKGHFFSTQDNSTVLH